jgi:hypothetical protein
MTAFIHRLPASEHPSGPPEVVNAAYCALAKKVHPDAGGDTTKMQAMNAADKLLQDNYA